MANMTLPTGSVTVRAFLKIQMFKYWLAQAFMKSSVLMYKQVKDDVKYRSN